MQTHVDKNQENQSRSTAVQARNEQKKNSSAFQFVDNRPEAVAQRKRQEMANNSPHVKQVAQLQASLKENKQKDGNNKVDVSIDSGNFMKALLVDNSNIVEEPHSEMPIQRVVSIRKLPPRGRRRYRTTYLTIEANLVDHTGQYNRIQLRMIARRMQNQFRESYSGIHRHANLIISLARRIPRNAHVIRIMPQGNIPRAIGRNGVLGRAPFGQNLLYISSHIIGRVPAVNDQYAGTGRDANGGGTLERTSAHELGHSLGLRHPPENGPYGGNLMHQTRRGNAGLTIGEDQINQIEHSEQQGELNLGDQG